jgi:hypothetical protein
MFFVDDIILIYYKDNEQKVNQFKDKFTKHFPMRDIGELKWFLGIRIIQDRAQRKLWMCQDSYIEKIANHFHLADIKTPATPMVIAKAEKNKAQASLQRILEYQQNVGSALFATIIT